MPIKPEYKQHMEEYNMTVLEAFFRCHGTDVAMFTLTTLERLGIGLKPELPKSELKRITLELAFSEMKDLAGDLKDLDLFPEEEIDQALELAQVPLDERKDYVLHTK